jgi:hypothetical protein
MEYNKRIVDAQFAIRMEALGAVQIKARRDAGRQRLRNRKPEV